MSKTSATTKQESTPQTINLLVEIGKLDTLYRDVYLNRAHQLMDSLLPYSTYTHLKDSAASIGWTERQLRASVERGYWDKCQAMTERLRALKESVSQNAESMRLGETVYEGLAEVPIDPFSTGFDVFIGGSKEQLFEWKARAQLVLNSLERIDPSKKDFYARRASDFKRVSVKASQVQSEETTTDASQLRADALNALDSGNLGQLDTLLEKLMEKPKAKEDGDGTKDLKPQETTELGDDLLYSFKEDTLNAAKELGLTPVRTNSRREFAYLIPHGWQPSFMTDEIRKWSKEQITQLSFPSGTTDKARDAIEFYLLNPFINSGGTRYKVCLVAEDLLLEDFPEPEPRQQMPKTKLLAELGFESRWGLSRLDIENSLLQHGPRIVAEQLKLDPEAFRIVAIPADIYTHIGPNRGWGQKEMWTHFDGYRVLREGKLQALAGGDIRFGGTHDVVSFARSYTNDKILTRFAVVQRKRMMSWQHA